MAEHVSVRRINAALRVYLFIRDPQKLTDKNWAQSVMDLHYIKQQEAEQTK